MDSAGGASASGSGARAGRRLERRTLAGRLRQRIDLPLHLDHPEFPLGGQPVEPFDLAHLLAQSFLRPSVFGNVARRGIDEIAGGIGAPLDPTIRTVLAPVAIHEVQHGLLAHQLADGGQGRGLIVGMYQIDKALSLQLLQGITEHRLPLRVQSAEMAIGVGNAQEVQSHREEAVQLLDLFPQSLLRLFSPRPEDLHSAPENAGFRLDRAQPPPQVGDLTTELFLHRLDRGGLG